MNREHRRELIRQVTIVVRNAAHFSPHYLQGHPRDMVNTLLTRVVKTKAYHLLNKDALIEGLVSSIALYQNAHSVSDVCRDLARFDEELCGGYYGLRLAVQAQLAVAMLRIDP